MICEALSHSVLAQVFQARRRANFQIGSTQRSVLRWWESAASRSWFLRCQYWYPHFLHKSRLLQEQQRQVHHTGLVAEHVQFCWTRWRLICMCCLLQYNSSVRMPSPNARTPSSSTDWCLHDTVTRNEISLTDADIDNSKQHTNVAITFEVCSSKGTKTTVHWAMANFLKSLTHGSKYSNSNLRLKLLYF